MLIFALEYRKAIDKISGGRELRKYELEEEEWKIVQQLCDILEVCHSLFVLAASTYSFAVVQGCDPLFFAFDAESRHCDTRNGSHQRTSCHSNRKPGVFAGHSCCAGTRKGASQ